MPGDLLDQLTELVTPDLLSRAASQFGESEGGIAKALGAAAPALLAGLVGKANDGGMMRQLLGLLTDPANDTGLLRNPAAALGAERSPAGSLASRFISLALGGRSDAVTQAIARYAGVRDSSASTLLSVAAPLVMGLLGDRAKRGGFGAQDLASLLLGERSKILAALPAGLGALFGADTRQAPPVTTRREAPVTTGGSRWLWPVLVGVLLIAGLWWLLRGAPDAPRVAEAPPRPAVELPAVSAPPPVRIVARDLPGGIRIEVPATGLETRLIAVVEDPNRPLDDDAWFEFDRITFETDSARLRPDSRAQIRDLAAILRAYPTTEVKIGGYTDSTGDPAANVQLSQARAEAVRSELVAQGINAERVEAEGYGAAHPIASNDTEQGREQNRRIALRVTER